MLKSKRKTNIYVLMEHTAATKYFIQFASFDDLLRMFLTERIFNPKFNGGWLSNLLKYKFYLKDFILEQPKPLLKSFFIDLTKF